LGENGTSGLLKASGSAGLEALLHD